MAENKGNFPATRWSMVLAAGDTGRPEARTALSSLCEAYWEPLYAFLRRKGLDPDAAADRVQGFFVVLLSKDQLRGVQAERGKFRTYLLSALTHFLINEREREQALKRGGGASTLTLDVDEAERRYLGEPTEQLTPERLFERHWALALLERTVESLGQEYGKAGKTELFDHIRVYLSAAGGPSYADVARELKMTEGAVKVAVHRLKQRYRDALRAEILQTVADEKEVDAEIRHLFAALGDP